MNDRRRILLFDGGQALVWAVLGFVFASPGEIQTVWWIAAATVILSALALGLEEHGYVPADTWTWFVVALSGVVAVAAVAVSVGPALRTVSALLVGLGVGVLGYRLVYGVVRPIPERRLERARSRGV